MRLKQAAALVLILLVGACARISGQGAQSASTSVDDGGGGRFAHPIGDSVDVPDRQYADARLPFKAVFPPPSVGPVVRTLMNNPERSEPFQRGIAWVIDTGDGPFYILEGPKGVQSQEELESLAECGPTETGCTTKGWSLVKLTDGRTALLVDGALAHPGGSTTWIAFMSDDMKVEVIGSKGTFTAQEALAVANDLVAAGA